MFPVIPLNQSHGDGRNAVFTIKIPLSEKSIDREESPIDPETGLARVPLLGEVLRMVGKATVNVMLGLKVGNKQSITIKQPLPEWDDEIIKHISIKRLFFHIEKVNPLEREKKDFVLFRWFRKLLRGSDKLDFSFIQELDIDMGMERTAHEPVDYLPCVVDKKDPESCPGGVATDHKGRSLPRLNFLRYRYAKRDKLLNLKDKELGEIYVVHTEKPVALRKFFREHEEFGQVIKEMTLVSKTLLVELKSGEMVDAKFLALLERYEEDMEGLKLPLFAQCEDMTCIDVKLSNENLLPMLKEGNLLNIHTKMDLKKAPNHDFQMKGFIEFEIRLDSPL